VLVVALSFFSARARFFKVAEFGLLVEFAALAFETPLLLTAVADGLAIIGVLIFMCAAAVAAVAAAAAAAAFAAPREVS